MFYGYRELLDISNGFLCQWGTLNSAGNPGTGTVTLPTAFTNTTYRISVTVTGMYDWFNAWGMGVTTKTTTTFGVYFKTDNKPVDYIAVGY